MLNSHNGSNMLVREAIIRFIEEKGGGFVFHLPGVHTLPLNDAFSRSNIRVIVGRHESNVAFMADGFARATGKPAVVLVTPGPGLGNIVSPCMEAYADDVPLIVIVIDVERKDVGKGVLHGIPSPETAFSHITKEIYRITDVEGLHHALNDAHLTATRPRTGPVLISLAHRLLDRECPSGPEVGEVEGPLPRPSLLDSLRLEEAFTGKERPIIVAGRALTESAAGSAIDDLCSSCGIPVLTTTSGKGVLREDHPWVFGAVTGKGVARELLASADVVLAIGTRLREVDVKRRGVKIANLIHCDVDERWFGKNYRTSVALSGEMRGIVETLCRTLRRKRLSWDIDRLDIARRQELRDLEMGHPGFRIVRLLRRLVP